MTAARPIAARMAGLASGAARPYPIGGAALLAVLLVGSVIATIWYVGGLSGDLEKAKAATDTAVAANLLWESDAALAKVDLLSCQAQWNSATANSADAVAEATKAADAARQNLSGWTSQWIKRTDACAAALVNMEDACASSLSHY